MSPWMPHASEAGSTRTRHRVHGTPVNLSCAVGADCAWDCGGTATGVDVGVVPHVRCRRAVSCAGVRVLRLGVERARLRWSVSVPVTRRVRDRLPLSPDCSRSGSGLSLTRGSPRSAGPRLRAGPCALAWPHDVTAQSGARHGAGARHGRTGQSQRVKRFTRRRVTSTVPAASAPRRERSTDRSEIVDFVTFDLRS
jgi:hypothetical protein